MLRAAEEDEEFADGVRNEPARKTEEAKALDATEAKKARKKLKRHVRCAASRARSTDGLTPPCRKERRKLEQQELMEKVRRNHKDANVKLIDSQMFAHGSNVPSGTTDSHQTVLIMRTAHPFLLLLLYFLFLSLWQS